MLTLEVFERRPGRVIACIALAFAVAYILALTLAPRQSGRILNGDAVLSIRGDEAEEAWRVLTPVIEGWANDHVPIDDYAAGSEGPD